MADFQLICLKNEPKTSLNCRNIAFYQETESKNKMHVSELHEKLTNSNFFACVVRIQPKSAYMLTKCQNFNPFIENMLMKKTVILHFKPEANTAISVLVQ